MEMRSVFGKRGMILNTLNELTSVDNLEDGREEGGWQ